MIKGITKQKAKIEFSAGGVVYQKSKNGPLVGFILDPYKKWGLAKGHIEKNERPEDAAIRETKEEMGISNLRLSDFLGKNNIWFYERFRQGAEIKGSRSLIHKIIYYFLMETSRGTRGNPQRKENIRAVRWVNAAAAVNFCSYKNIKPIVAKAVEIIKQRNHFPRHQNKRRTV